jgi:hypothetical protein
MSRLIYYLIVLSCFLFMAFYSILVIRDARDRALEFRAMEDQLGIVTTIDRSVDDR